MMEENFSAIKPEIYRSHRKTISIELKPGRLIVRAPYRMSTREISAFIQGKKGWIEKHLLRMMERQKAVRQQGPYTDEELKDLAEKARMRSPKK